MNYKQVKTIEFKNKQRLLKVNPKLNEESGIYILTRQDENGFKFCYVGQAVHILTRLAQHLVGYQHIDLSLKRHGLFSADNPYGWQVNYLTFPQSELDEQEQFYIKKYANAGYQLRNKTGGSQGIGKVQIDEYRPAKGYRDGIKQGRKTMARDIKALFDKHLNVSTKDVPPSRYQTAALDKFNMLLKEGDGENAEQS